MRPTVSDLWRHVPLSLWVIAPLSDALLLLPYMRQDFDERSLQAVVRASVHYYNTEEEVSALVAAVANVR